MIKLNKAEANAAEAWPAGIEIGVNWRLSLLACETGVSIKPGASAPGTCSFQI